MTPELHRQFKKISPYEMLQELISMFEKQAGVERFDLIQTFHACKQEDGKSVSQYVLKMKGYVDKLERLGYVLPQDLSVGLILNGFTSDFAEFVRNHNMHNMGKTIGELHAMLIEYEKGLPKKAVTPQVMEIHGGRIQKANKKSQNAKGKVLQVLRGARKLKQGDLYLSMGNGIRAQVEAIISYDLVLPNGLEICLYNCHYYGIYEIDMSNFVPNVNSIYNVSNKRVKHNLDSTYLWHRRLAHISKKCIGNLQHDGLLKSTDDESFDQYMSCLSSKMTRKSFSHRPERATDLLGLIHTDVCGPLRHMSRRSASYLITFTDDYSRYGYIYLLKHKHEVFETIKMFKNEVENQLGKTIKAFRSDRGGEYISQEFKDYLKACGIVQQLTPPYTPQQNGVFERRNRTLLNMVRSMMNLTTLPLSFWNYALEAAACILNMVLTKKVDKTPYKLCGRAGDLEEIQDKDTSPSEITSEIPIEVEVFEPPHEEEALVHRSERPHQAPNRLCLNVEVEEHSLRDLNEPANYKATMLDPESNKWLDAMNADMQSMKDNQVWRLVDLPPNGLIMKKRSHPLLTLELLGFSLAIVAFYDYEIWQMDVKTTILNGYLDEDIYMVQPEGFIDLNIPKKMDNSKRGYIPMQERLDLNKMQGASTPEEVKHMQNVPYASAVGSIMYVTAVKTILKYLRNTKDMFLVYGGNPKAELRVDCYCDAGFETDRDDTKSQTGYTAEARMSAFQAIVHACPPHLNNIYLGTQKSRKNVNNQRRINVDAQGEALLDSMSSVTASRPSTRWSVARCFPYSRWTPGCRLLRAAKSQLTPLYTPQHNGVYERRNRTFLDTVRSIMNLSTLSLSFWDYTQEYVARILNMVPTKKVDKTPYDLWYEKVHDLSYLKFWGCGVLVKRDTLDKLQQRSVKCIFIGYPKEKMGYYFYFLPENKIVVASKIPMEVEGFEPPQEEVVPVHRSARTHRDPNRLSDFEANVLAEWSAMYDVHNEVDCLMLGSMTHELHRQFENYSPYEMLQELSSMFEKQSGVERFDLIQTFHACKQEEDSGSNVTFLILYVDDIIIMGNHIPSLQSVKDCLRKCFAMKDLGEAAFTLGIKIYTDRSKRLIGLGQNAYMDKILKRYKMDNSKRGYIPMQERLDLNKTQGASTPEEVKRMQNVPYASAVGSIINLEAELRVDCYCNAGFETDIDDMKSQIEYVFILNGRRKMEAVWIRKFISGLGIVPTINESIRMFCDNSAALHFANEPGVQKGTRHYHRRYHYVRESIALGEIRFLKVHTDDKLADPFTKAFVIQSLLNMLGAWDFV
nr:retrotransposon protein, putative, Ty1-copia subclass [Tanacetum cinerariifolium]